MEKSLNIQVELHGKSHYKNFRKLCWKLANQGNVEKLKSFRVIEKGYKRKLTECPENTLLLECIEKAKEIRLKNKLEKGLSARYGMSSAIHCAWIEKPFQGIAHNL